MKGLTSVQKVQKSQKGPQSSKKVPKYFQKGYKGPWMFQWSKRSHKILIASKNRCSSIEIQKCLNMIPNWFKKVSNLLTVLSNFPKIFQNSPKMYLKQISHKSLYTSKVSLQYVNEDSTKYERYPIWSNFWEYFRIERLLLYEICKWHVFWKLKWAPEAKLELFIQSSKI